MVTVVSRTRGRGGWFKYQKISRQGRPYLSPLPYITYGVTLRGVPGQQNTVGSFPSPAYDEIGGRDGSCYAKAYDRVANQLKGQASAMLAVNIAERRQSFDMIANRAGQLLGAYRSFRSGRVRDGLKQLGFKLKKTRKSHAWVRTGKGRTYSLPKKKVELDEYAFKRKLKTGGSLWLEYWFGWSPLISDIHNACEILQDVSLNLRNVYTGSATRRNVRREGGGYWYQGRYYEQWRTWKATFGCLIRARIVIKSPNAQKANSLGLVNPALVAWELIPGSFLLDWILPVGRFLESYTDFVGCTIQNVQISTRNNCEYTDIGTTPWEIVNASHNAFYYSRTISGTLPIPGIMSRSGTGIASLTRAATAVSLLTGFLKPSKWS